MKKYSQAICYTHPCKLLGSLLCLLAVFVSSFSERAAAPVKECCTVRKLLPLPVNCTSIQIDGDMSVVLTNDAARSATIEGKQKDVSAVSTITKNNAMVINAARRFSFGKLTLYLPAPVLQSIQVNGNGDISSADYIKTSGLHITLNGNITVKVKTAGRISFDSPDDIELKRKTNFLQTGIQGKYEQRPSDSTATLVAVHEWYLQNAPCSVFSSLLQTLL